MKHSLKAVAIVGVIAVVALIGLRVRHANRVAADAATADSAASRETELLPENPDRAPVPHVPAVPGGPGADHVAGMETPPDSTPAQQAIPQSEFRAIVMPAPSTGVPPGAGEEWVRAFRKQERDEAWARPLETEIQKSLQGDIDQGRFYVSNIECRTTLCEVRLMAQGSLQVTELELFESELSQLPWVGRLDAALASGSGNRESYEAVWIFEKRPEPAQR